jgi:hypothetical protein
MHQPAIGEVFGDRSHVAAEHVPTPILPQLDVQDPHLQDITDLRFAHVDWAGKDVIAGAFRHLVVDIEKVGKNIEAAILRRQQVGRSGDAFNAHALA